MVRDCTSALIAVGRMDDKDLPKELAKHFHARKKAFDEYDANAKCQLPELFVPNEDATHNSQLDGWCDAGSAGTDLRVQLEVGMEKISKAWKDFFTQTAKDLGDWCPL